MQQAMEFELDTFRNSMNIILSDIDIILSD